MALKEEMSQELMTLQVTVNSWTREIEQGVDEMEEGIRARDVERRKILVGEMKKVLFKLNDIEQDIVKDLKGEALDHLRNMTKLSDEIAVLKASLEALPADSKISLHEEVAAVREKVLHNNDEDFAACLKGRVHSKHDCLLKPSILCIDKAVCFHFAPETSSN